MRTTMLSVLRFAQKAARNPGATTDADLESLRAAGLSTNEIFEAPTTRQLFSGVNLFSDVADIEIDQV